MLEGVRSTGTFAHQAQEPPRFKRFLVEIAVSSGTPV